MRRPPRPSALAGLAVLAGLLLAPAASPAVAVPATAVPATAVPAPAEASAASPHPAADQRAATVLKLVNQARAEGRTCGSTKFGSKPPLRRSPALERSAQKHAASMAKENYFSHTGSDGSEPIERMQAAGYRGSYYGENIAAGQTTPRAVVQSWLRSEGHCRNIMGAFKHLGVGYARGPRSDYGHYWVQNFGKP